MNVIRFFICISISNLSNSVIVRIDRIIFLVRLRVSADGRIGRGLTLVPRDGGFLHAQWFVLAARVGRTPLVFDGLVQQE